MLHPCHIFDHKIRGSVVKIGIKIPTHLSANISVYALHARFIFSTGKNLSAPSELILQMVKYLYDGSHVKPWRVKMHMWQTEKDIKTMNVGHSVSFALDKNWFEEKWQ